MSRARFGEQDILERIQDSVAILDTVRTTGMESLRTILEIRNQVASQELSRLTKKYGEDHPRVQALTTRLAYDRRMVGELDRQIEEAKIQVPVIDQDTWMVHGRILDKSGTGIPNLSVWLANESGNWYQSAGVSSTDDHGYFAIAFKPTDEEVKSLELYLAVSDSERQILRQSEPLAVQRGRINSRQVIVTRRSGERVWPRPETRDVSGSPDRVASQERDVRLERTEDENLPKDTSDQLPAYESMVRATVASEADAFLEMPMPVPDEQHDEGIDVDGLVEDE